MVYHNTWLPWLFMLSAGHVKFLLLTETALLFFSCPSIPAFLYVYEVQHAIKFREGLCWLYIWGYVSNNTISHINTNIYIKKNSHTVVDSLTHSAVLSIMTSVLLWCVLVLSTALKRVKLITFCKWMLCVCVMTNNKSYGSETKYASWQ